METFALNLRRRARELGFSDAEVARRAGLSERRYGHYVAGTREPDLGTLVKICSALGTTPDALLLTDPEDVAPGQVDRTRERLQATVSLLTDRQAELAVEVIEAIVRWGRT